MFHDNRDIDNVGSGDFLSMVLLFINKIPLTNICMQKVDTLCMYVGKLYMPRFARLETDLGN